MTEEGQGGSVSGFEHLLSPIEIRGTVLKNRVCTTGHAVATPWMLGNSVADYLEYARARARGGVAMIISDPLVIDPYPLHPGMIADRFAAAAEAVHAEDTRILSQLTFYGGQIGSHFNHLAGRPMWSLNGRQDDWHAEASHRMTGDEILEMVDTYARAARVSVEAGMDGSELHGGHGYLLHQSFSPWGNGRDDEWGERYALTRAVVLATRAAIGPDKILGLRVTADDLLRPDEGGQSQEEILEIIAEIASWGAVDYINPTIGTKAPAYSQQSVASYRYPDGYDLPYAAAIRKATGGSVLVMGVGGVQDAALGEKALADGICDLVGMTRAHIADPQVITKIKRGEYRRITPCVRALDCTDRKLDGKSRGCAVNPFFMRERSLNAVPTDQTPASVLVIGAGPAGLKAAQIAAGRGHTVRLVDAAEEPGGRLRPARHTAGRRVLRAVDQMVDEIGRLGVTLELGRRVRAADLAGFGADEIILATGAVPDPTTAFAHDGSVPLLSVEAALADDVPDGPVLVLDRAGRIEVALTVEVLMQRGHHVTYVTPHETILLNAGYSHRFDFRDLFRRNPLIRLLPEHEVRRLESGTAVLIDPDGVEVETVDASSVVVGVHPVPVVDLVEPLGALGVPYQVVGESLAPRGLSVALQDAAYAAMRIGLDPAERQLVFAP